jgi:hypothetical protein
MTERIRDGVLDGFGRPLVAATMWYDATPLHVVFLIDTGSDRTILSGADLFRFGTGRVHKKPRKTIEADTYGKAVVFRELPVVVGFRTRHHVLQYDVEVCIPPDEDLERDIPSLLGRDILNRWRVVVDYPKRELSLLARTWDGRYPVSPNIRSRQA